MNLTNCSLDVDHRADDGQFTPAPSECGLERIWFAPTADGISIRLDGGIQLNVTVTLTSAAARDLAATLRQLVDGYAEQPPQHSH